MKYFIVLTLAILFANTSHAKTGAKLNVVATTTDIGAIVRAVGGDHINLSVIAKGSQDPHYIEAKPSYMVKLRDADLLVSNGLSLEIGWLPALILGARNPKVNPGARGNLDLGSFIVPIEKPTGTLTRAMGDVHPDGNPHFTLDPIRDGDLSLKVAERLSDMDPANKAAYTQAANTYRDDLIKRTADWQKRLVATGIKEVVTYHPSLDYFVDRFQLQVPINLEAKPGVPPTTQHILDVIEMVKHDKIKIILVDNFFDTKIADRVAKDAPGVRVESIGNAVDSAPGLNSTADVIEALVKAFEKGK
jgi:zinc/manganese transport system substrate-binding protein